ncbi:MAG TPA: NADH-quinone oxidoreductase subunit F, partial [Chitinophagaceae bacterium]|nr:NADH-quinone oxidoreductase subunit F [Chitinophagaceae bacterium]
LLAATTTIFLLSLAGIPLTAGFLSKFYMLKAALATGKNLWLVIFAVLMAAVSAYYYFRVIQAMYFKEPGTSSLHNSAGKSGFQALLVVLAILILILGVYPEFLIGWMYHL